MKDLFRKMLATDNSVAPVVLRLALGGVMLPHGLQKTIGAFGGYGFSGTMSFFTESAGLPWIIALLVIAAESLGALALLLGFMTRFCAASLALVMAGAAVMVHASNGFFMNWYGAQAGEGFEYHLLAIGLGATLALTGAGRWSVDRALEAKLR